MTLSPRPRLTGLLAGVALLPLSLTAGARTATVPPAAVDRVKVDYQTFTLPNGLKAIVYTDHTVPSVYIGIRYYTGSKDEPEGRSGFAHLFEHLMFQSTKNRSGDFLPAMTAIGATGVNGMTTMDGTDYYETVPTNALDYALWLESDRMGYLADGITQKELDEQRGVVENEKRQGELQPGAKVQERYFASYYPAGHPYAHTTIGSMADLDRASLADVKRWFNDYYGASNAVLVLSGDIDLATAKEKVTRYFGAVRPGTPIDRPAAWVPVFTAPKRDVLYDKIGNATIHRSWPVPNDDPRTITMLLLAARSIAGAEDTPLNKALVDQQKVALGVAASVSEHQLDSSFDIDLAVRPGVTPDQANAALDAALAQFFVRGPDKARLDTIIAASNISLVRMMESAPAVGSRLLQNYTSYGDPMFFLKQRDWAAAATPDDVRLAVKTYLSRPYYEMQMRPAPMVRAASADVDRSHPPELAPFKGEVKFPATREATLSNGMKLVVAERHNLPIVNVSMQFATGTQADAGYTPGAARNAFGMMEAGTDKYTGAVIANRLSNLGVNFTANAGGRQSSVGWSTLTSALDQSFALASDMIRHPSYPQDRFAEATTGIDTTFEAYERNPINAAGPLFNQAIWGKDHLFGKLTTRDEARKLSRDAVVRFHDHEIAPNNATLYAIGDVTLEQARALAERYFGDWKQEPVSTIATPLPPAGVPGRVILVDAPGAPQSSISVGRVVAPYDRADAAAEGMADAILAGSFDSRLNTDLREEKGWAYGFSGGIATNPTGPRVFTMGGSVQVDKTADSMAEIRRQLADYVGDKPATAEELEREKMAAIRAIPSGYTGNGAFLAAMIASASYGLPYNYLEGSSARTQAVTLDRVRALSQRMFGPDQLTWVVVGDLSVIEKDVRALNLGPVEVWDVYGKKLR